MTEDSARKTAHVSVQRPDGLSDKINEATSWEVQDENGVLVVECVSGWVVYPGGSWQRMTFDTDEESQ